MEITLISQEQYDQLVMIQIGFSILTFQNNGYEYIDKKKFTAEDKEAYDTVSAILSKHITGFREFFNFKIREDGEVVIRFNYNYGVEDNSMSFTGVGYLGLKELLNGFDYIDDGKNK